MEKQVLIQHFIKNQTTKFFFILFVVGAVSDSFTFPSNRFEMAMVMSTPRNLGQPQEKEDGSLEIAGEKLSFKSVFWTIPMSARFGIYMEWTQFFVSAFCMLFCGLIWRAVVAYDEAVRRETGCLGFLISLSYPAMLFYAFCCIRALF